MAAAEADGRAPLLGQEARPWHTPPIWGVAADREVQPARRPDPVAKPSCWANGETDPSIFHGGCGMADSAIFIGWGEGIAGREQSSLTLFNEVLAYYTGLQKRGEIESFEAVLLEPHGGDLDGFLLIRGEAEKLDRVRRSEEFLGYNARAGLALHNLGVVRGWIGAGLERQFAVFGKLAAEL